MRYTYNELLESEIRFRQFNIGFDKLLDVSMYIGTPKGYMRGIDYIYEVLDMCCYNMSKDEVMKLCEAIDHVQFKRMHYHWDNKIPYPQDYDMYKENYKDVIEYLKYN